MLYIVGLLFICFYQATLLPSKWQHLDGEIGAGLTPVWDCFGQPLCEYIELFISTTTQPPKLSSESPQSLEYPSVSLSKHAKP